MDSDVSGKQRQVELRSDLFRKSLSGQARLRHVQNLLGPTQGQACLVIGGGGLVARSLQKRGGAWQSAGLTDEDVAEAKSIAGDPVARIEPPAMPFADGTFDAIVMVDVLDRIEQDYKLIAECHRVLKPNGRIVFTVPHFKKWALLLPVRQMLRLPPGPAGQVRPGYTESQVFDLMKDGFDVQELHSYSRFFSEAAGVGGELIGRTAARGGEPDLGREVRLRTSLYPLAWLLSRLDALLPFSKGHQLAGRARRRRQWIPRRVPVLADGRSIAEAALGGKIGTAAPF